MKNIVKALIMLMLINIGLSQDEIYTKTGKVIIAKVDTSTVKKGTQSIRYKKRFESSYKFLSVNSINFIRSWNGSLLYPVGVIVNTTSGKIHLPNVEHLPGEFERLEYASKEEAVNDIYKVLRPGEPPSFEIAKEIFNNLFFTTKSETPLSKQSLLKEAVCTESSP